MSLQSLILYMLVYFVKVGTGLAAVEDPGQQTKERNQTFPSRPASLAPEPFPLGAAKQCQGFERRHTVREDGPGPRHLVVAGSMLGWLRECESSMIVAVKA